ncbi:hypothetical protein D3C80_919780 [compost metagenome]
MVLQAHRGFDLINVEGMGAKARHCRAGQLAAGGKHQAVVAQCARVASLVAVANGFCLFVDVLGGAFDKTHPHRVEQPVQWREHLVHVGFVKPGADTQLGLGRQQGNFHVAALVHVQQAGGTQRTPDTTEACANNQDMLFHECFLSRSGQ